MPSDQRELLLEEPQDTGCLKKPSLPCMLILILLAILLISLAVGLAILVLEQAIKPPVVDLDCGRVTGEYDVHHDVLIFRGIPYAAPPVGELRWRRPVPMVHTEAEDACWSDTLKATTSNSCPQLNPLTKQLQGEEDCLKVDVLAPGHGLRTSLLPVVVNIHGGGFTSLNNSVPGYSPDVTLSQDMHAVFVSVNYRLGPLGFLVAEKLGKNQTGNYGIWDQIEALKWVKKNIVLFGGDPKQVTLVGHGSGATAVKTLLVSPHAKGLFHQAWMMSASPKMTATLKDAKDSDSNKKLVSGTGCKDAACLRDLPISKIFEKIPEQSPAADLFPRKGVFPDPFIVIDGDLIPEDIEGIWKKKNAGFSDVPILIGTTAQETDSQWPENKNNYTRNEMINDTQNLLNDFGDNLTTDALASYNFTESLQNPVYQVTTLSSDIYLTCGNNRIAAAAADTLTSPVYRYIVTHSPSSSVSPFNGPYVSNFAFGGWDAFAFFNGQEEYMDGAVQKSDLDFKKALQKVAKEFTKYGKISDWGKYPESTAVMGQNITFLQGTYHKEQCDFWKSKGLLDYEFIN